jgi:hypothetical protein
MDRQIMDKKRYIFLSILKGVRNISLYLFLYIFAKIIPIYEEQMIFVGSFMKIYGYLSFFLFLVGTYASQKIKDSKGDFEHFKYLKVELVFTIVLIILLELFIF